MRRSRTFTAERQSVSAARRFATEALVGAAEDVLQAVELMVSELATNCVRHVRSSFDLTVHRAPEEIRVEVTDYGGGTPRVRSPGPDEPTGRGLAIVEMLSERWGVQDEHPTGKTVWFTLAAATAGAGAAVQECAQAHHPDVSRSSDRHPPSGRSGAGGSGTPEPEGTLRACQRPGSRRASPNLTVTRRSRR